LIIGAEVGDRAREAITIGSIGLLHDHRGNWQAALDFYEQALLIHREVEGRLGEAITPRSGPATPGCGRPAAHGRGVTAVDEHLVPKVILKGRRAC
jgi:hypothetical protein